MRTDLRNTEIGQRVLVTLPMIVRARAYGGPWRMILVSSRIPMRHLYLD
jgi:hypothetical protein